MQQKSYPREQWSKPTQIIKALYGGRDLPDGWTREEGQYEGHSTITLTNEEGQEFTFINEPLGGLSALPDYQEKMEERLSRRKLKSVDAFGKPLQIPDLDALLLAGSVPEEFVIPGWVPRGCLTLLYGAGGTGKTALMLTTAARLAIGRSVFNELPQLPFKVLFFSSEDGRKQTGRRLRSIISRLGIDGEEYETLKENLRLPDVERVNMSMVRETNDKSARSTVVPSAFYHVLLNVIKQEAPDIVILDPLSDLFELNENDRMQVSSFMRLMHNLALDQNIAIILIGHPGKSEDSEYSGSTAWNNKARYRIWARLDRDTHTVELRQKKHQYSQQAKALFAKWEDGAIDVMLPEDTHMHIETRRAELANKVYDILEGQERLGKHPTTQTRAESGLISIVMQRLDGRKKVDVVAGIDQLLEAGRIAIVRGDGKDGRPRVKSGGTTLDFYATRKSMT
ncbi:AAA family ATPase [Ruegeria sp. HKCCA6707]|uniref:AAA family ATPase n=1 Tax=Ruegeria sp. HKCCA6707 TaxID=2682996 RepID=UPI0014894A99|nr:AAA family ATPase [Ruegeria sp. HKCCA6707]